MKIILPAAGYGTRMYPLTKDMPKALLEVNGKVVLDYLIEKIERVEGISEVIIVTNNKFYDKFVKWRENCPIGDIIKIINDGSNNDGERRGSIGSIMLAIEEGKIDEDIMTINPDTLASFDLVKLKEFFDEKDSCVIGLFDVKKIEVANDKGKTKLDEDNRIVFFKEKDKIVPCTLCSTGGLYLLKKNEIGFVRKYLEEGNNLDASGKFIEWLYLKEKVYGYVFDESNYYFDIGSLSSYEEAKRFMSSLT